MVREKLIQGIREEMKTGEIRKKLFPMMTDFGIRDYSETVHTMGLNYLTAIGRTIIDTTAISECPVYSYEKKSFVKHKAAEINWGYSVKGEPTVRPDSIWYSTKDNQPLLLCEFERYDNSRLKNKKLEEKIQNLLIAYHQLGGNVPLILFVYWTYSKVTPGDISNYIRIFDEGFTMGNGIRVYGINGRKTEYLVYHCVASGDKENLTFNQWIKVR
ncbi:hypothetical protein RBH29_15950 [Herbivorax sp. ANBcel31]|uniref:hypothetical protein n=1 Tax=Herbivorax sp. ANBcel31 TaxID=3069754 RepID=UPI0027AF3936|nr:hypothetical protein [Herbivorax sp. ANBcel31]MDQ2087923.1 hypothetical protein [Herbivorax sp. ANBcel31]